MSEKNTENPDLHFPEALFGPEEEEKIIRSLNEQNGNEVVEDLDDIVEAVPGVTRKDLQADPSSKDSYAHLKYFKGGKIDHPTLIASLMTMQENHCRCCGLKTQSLYSIALDNNRLNPELDNWAAVCIMCRNAMDLRFTLVNEKRGEHLDKLKGKQLVLARVAHIPEVSQENLNHLMRTAFGVAYKARPEVAKASYDVLNMLYSRTKRVQKAWGSSDPVDFMAALSKVHINAYDMRSISMHGLRIVYNPILFEDQAPIFAEMQSDHPFKLWSEKIFAPFISGKPINVEA